MNNVGHKKGNLIDDDGYRQFIVNAFGDNDQTKYYVVSPFGIDYNPPNETRTLNSDSMDKDKNFVQGVLNKLKIDDLALGESAIFSTDEEGTEIKSKIVCRNTGAVEINKGLDGVQILLNSDGSLGIITTGNAIIDVDGDVGLTASGNVNVTATQLNVNGGNLTVD
jgi:hypothetical protein